MRPHYHSILPPSISPRPCQQTIASKGWLKLILGKTCNSSGQSMNHPNRRTLFEVYDKLGNCFILALNCLGSLRLFYIFEQCSYQYSYPCRTAWNKIDLLISFLSVPLAEGCEWFFPDSSVTAQWLLSNCLAVHCIIPKRDIQVSLTCSLIDCSVTV